MIGRPLDTPHRHTFNKQARPRARLGRLGVDAKVHNTANRRCGLPALSGAAVSAAQSEPYSSLECWTVRHAAATRRGSSRPKQPCCPHRLCPHSRCPICYIPASPIVACGLMQACRVRRFLGRSDKPARGFGLTMAAAASCCATRNQSRSSRPRERSRVAKHGGALPRSQSVQNPKPRQ